MVFLKEWDFGLFYHRLEDKQWLYVALQLLDQIVLENVGLQNIWLCVGEYAHSCVFVWAR